MPPPYTPTVSRSRRQLLDEPEPLRYFPSSQSPMNGFSSYGGPAKAASDRLTLDEIMAKRDEQETRLAQNAVQRRDLEARDRLRPFVTGAGIAKAKYDERKATLDEENSPFAAGYEKERYITGAEQERAERTALPEKEKLAGMGRAAAIEEIQNRDPYFDRLSKLTKGDPDTGSAYESFLRNAPKDSDAETARKYAYDSAMKLTREREAVEAIDSMDAIGRTTALREELLEDVFDPETGAYIGSTIKKDANQKKVAETLRTARNQRRLESVTKAEQAQLNKGVQHLDDAIGEYTRQIANFEKNSLGGDDTADIIAARTERQNLINQRGKMYERLGILPSSGAQPVPAPAPAPVIPAATEPAKPPTPAAAPAAEPQKSKETERERYLRNFREAKKMVQGG